MLFHIQIHCVFICICVQFVVAADGIFSTVSLCFAQWMWIVFLCIISLNVYYYWFCCCCCCCRCIHLSPLLLCCCNYIVVIILVFTCLHSLLNEVERERLASGKENANEKVEYRFRVKFSLFETYWCLVCRKNL